MNCTDVNQDRIAVEIVVADLNNWSNLVGRLDFCVLIRSTLVSLNHCCLWDEIQLGPNWSTFAWDGRIWAHFREAPLVGGKVRHPCLQIDTFPRKLPKSRHNSEFEVWILMSRAKRIAVFSAELRSDN